jgi:histidyl-tRNA synthetase
MRAFFYFLGGIMEKSNINNLYVDTMYYIKLESYLRRVCELYNYKEVKSDFLNTLLIKDEKVRFFYFEKDSNTFTIKSNYINQIMISDMISLLATILKGLSFKDYIINIFDQSLKNNHHFENVASVLDNLGINYNIDHNCINNVLEIILHDSIKVGYGFIESVDNSFVIKLDMDKLINLLFDVSKFNPKIKRMHIYFISDSLKSKIESLRIMNVCRYAGLICDMDYSERSYESQLELAIQSNAMFTCVLNDNELNNMVISIKNNDTDEEELIPLNDVYLYVLKYLQKNVSKCSSCHAKEE